MESLRKAALEYGKWILNVMTLTAYAGLIISLGIFMCYSNKFSLLIYLNENYGNLISATLTFAVGAVAIYFAYIQTKINQRMLNNELINRLHDHYVSLLSIMKELIQCEINPIIEQLTPNKVLNDFPAYKMLKNKYLDIYYEHNLFDSEVIKDVNQSIYKLIQEYEGVIYGCASYNEPETVSRSRIKTADIYISFHKKYDELTEIYKQEIHRLRNV